MLWHKRICYNIIAYLTLDVCLILKPIKFPVACEKCFDSYEKSCVAYGRTLNSICQHILGGPDFQLYVFSIFLLPMDHTLWLSTQA